MENFPEYEGDAVPTSEDAVLDELHEYVDAKNRSVSEDMPSKIHKSFERCEAYKVYEAYETGTLPTLQHVQSSVEKLLARISETEWNDPEKKKVLQLLKGRPQQLQAAVQSYVQSVIRFNRLYKLHKNGRDVEKQIADADATRRRRHDALFDTLSIHLKILEDAYDLGLCEKDDVCLWRMGNEAALPKERVPAFDRSVLVKDIAQNRKLVMEWAIAADFEKSFKQLTEIAAH